MAEAAALLESLVQDPPFLDGNKQAAVATAGVHLRMDGLESGDVAHHRNLVQLIVAAITVAEMLVGVELASSRYRPQRESFVADVVSSIPIVPYDLSVAGDHAKLLVAVGTAGRPRGAHDLIIAATARATNRTVITAESTRARDFV